MTKRHNCLFFSSMIFLSFKGLTNEGFSLISLTMLGHAKKTTDTTFTIFYNQVEIIQYALKGQKFLAQGIALGNYERQPVALKGQKR